MHKQGIDRFKYFVGIDSLAKVATREDRVCVLNILGGESSQVTPVSHAFSGGNVVFGTSPGRTGQTLRTPLGEVPVFSAVREGLDAGLGFNTGVIYLPPAGVRDGVAELARVNPELEKIVIVTEKVSVHDAREIRAIGQTYGIDIFGANGLGVADSWNRVRIGGALGGDHPGESLKQGSVALFSNSGNFTTTIAQYLATAGWGTTTLISSGKDVYIHFAAPEFVFALGNDERSRAAVMYVEPGGYYEQGLEPTKPVVACVVGRWKAKLTRAVGHAGALAGSGDDAASKERWLMETFGVDDIFTPQHPVCSARGAVVVNIAHIPQALTRVMALNGIEPDFAPAGDLSLKAWFGNNQRLRLPPELDLKVVAAMAPYDAQIAELRKHVGAVFLRQTMRDRSGASQMDPDSADHERSRLLGARSGQGAARGELRAAAGARDRGAERPGAARRRGRRRGQPRRRSGARGRRGRTRGGQRAEQRDGRGRQHHRPEARRARARLHRCADRPVRPVRPGRCARRELRSRADRGRRGERARCSSRPRPTRTCAPS